MEGRLRVLKALANYPCPVGVGCFVGFAKHAWPDETQGRRLNRWSRTAGAVLAKLGRAGFCRYQRSFFMDQTGWVITDAGLAELARLEDVLRSAELGGSQETSDAQR